MTYRAYRIEQESFSQTVDRVTVTRRANIHKSKAIHPLLIIFSFYKFTYTYSDLYEHYYTECCDKLHLT